MRHRTPITTLICALTILSAGCEFTSRSDTSPVSPTQVTVTPILLGTWSASTAPGGLPTPDACTALELVFDQQDGEVYTGTFHAVCADGIELTGTATGTYVDDVVTVTATGTASAAGLDCAFTLNGTARIMGEQITIEYTGTSCLGPVSGTHVLARG